MAPSKTHPRTVRIAGKDVTFTKPKADDYHSPERRARRAKKRAARRAS